MARILIIDDDPDIRPLLQAVLDRLGHETVAAGTGESGLALARAGGVDALVVDVMMPDLDGYEVTRQLRADIRTAHLPVMILTARTQAADHARALEVGADDYLPKPFDPSAIGARLTALLEAVRGDSGSGQVRRKAASDVVVVVGLGGGVGATTCAVNLAGAMSLLGRRVCLVDLSPSAGHVALHLNMSVHNSWSDLPPRPEAVDVGKILIRHETGLVVLPAPPHPVPGGLTDDAMLAVLDVLGNYFTDIVVDAAPVLDSATRAVLGAARRTLLVFAPEVGALHTAAAAMRVVPFLARPGSLFQVVCNHPAPQATVAPAVIERAMGRAPDITLPFDPAQAQALARGLPLVMHNPQAPLARALAEFAPLARAVG